MHKVDKYLLCFWHCSTAKLRQCAPRHTCRWLMLPMPSTPAVARWWQTRRSPPLLSHFRCCRFHRPQNACLPPTDRIEKRPMWKRCSYFFSAFFPFHFHGCFISLSWLVCCCYFDCYWVILVVLIFDILSRPTVWNIRNYFCEIIRWKCVEIMTLAMATGRSREWKWPVSSLRQGNLAGWPCGKWCFPFTQGNISLGATLTLSHHQCENPFVFFLENKQTIENHRISHRIDRPRSTWHAPPLPSFAHK